MVQEASSVVVLYNYNMKILQLVCNPDKHSLFKTTQFFAVISEVLIHMLQAMVQAVKVEVEGKVLKGHRRTASLPLARSINHTKKIPPADIKE